MIIALALMLGFFLGSVMTFAGLLFFAIVTVFAEGGEATRPRTHFASVNSSQSVDDSRSNATSAFQHVTYH